MNIHKCSCLKIIITTYIFIISKLAFDLQQKNSFSQISRKALTLTCIFVTKVTILNKIKRARMKKTYLLLTIVFYSTIVQANVINKKDAIAILLSIDKLGDEFGKIYNSPKPMSREKLNIFLKNFENITEPFPLLSLIRLKIKNAVNSKNDVNFWQAEEELRAMLRPIFIAARKPEKSYFALAMAKITNTATSFYRWLFPQQINE